MHGRPLPKSSVSSQGPSSLGTRGHALHTSSKSKPVPSPATPSLSHGEAPFGGKFRSPNHLPCSTFANCPLNLSPLRPKQAILPIVHALALASRFHHHPNGSFRHETTGLRQLDPRRSTLGLCIILPLPSCPSCTPFDNSAPRPIPYALYFRLWLP